jgi:hypothetical protein
MEQRTGVSKREAQTIHQVSCIFLFVPALNSRFASLNFDILLNEAFLEQCWIFAVVLL